MNDTKLKNSQKPFVSTRNACKLCAPLGASVAYKGIEGCVPLIHGSQGCATYVRRYLISHYKEPVDIASSNFSAETTIFGGESNLAEAIGNVYLQYKPELIGIASTCLSETIGDHVERYVTEYRFTQKDHEVVAASTPSYCGSHVDGFHQAVSAVVRRFAEKGESNGKIALFPGFLSPADYRHLKEIFKDLGVGLLLAPDISDTLDNPHWAEYQKLPEGGTPLADLRALGSAITAIQFGTVISGGMNASRVNTNVVAETPGKVLSDKCGVPVVSLPFPIGIKATDRFFDTIEEAADVAMPYEYLQERGRLIDAYVDGHKYVFGKKALVYGEEDFVIGICSLLSEIGMIPTIVGSGARSGMLKSQIETLFPDKTDEITVLDEADFEWMAELSRKNVPDIIIGHSKGYPIARELDIPLVRVGFPIHDRLGGQRLLHIGYRGTHRLFDEIANALISSKQAKSPVGYKYM
jgi:nitrogenase molybdenum-iron protein NifN